MKQKKVSQVAEFVNPLREFIGMAKPLPDLYDSATLIDECWDCKRYTHQRKGSYSQCPKHRDHG